MAQINATVGDIEGNARLILDAVRAAKGEGADLVVTPELCAFGYPPKDLVRRADLVARNEAAVAAIAQACRGISSIVGFVSSSAGASGLGLHNAAAFLHEGRVVATYAKRLLPTYDVFDETRYFDAGRTPRVVEVPTSTGVVPVGLTVCEDLWNDEQFDGRVVYGIDPVKESVEAGARVIVNISASPFRVGVQATRERLFRKQAAEHGVSVIYVNQVAANDDLIFDGASLVIDAGGDVVARAPAFQEVVKYAEVSGEGAADGCVTPYPTDRDSIHGALILGIRDYLRKTSFEEVVIGLSGGIDSALTAALAVEALGAKRVHTVAMPSRHSSDHSVQDAEALARNFELDFRVIPIEPMHRATEESLAGAFAGLLPDVTEENIQARIRGNLLMSLSNKFGWLLLTTGNKSELAVGYCTLYGDMCGGLAVLSDVPKTTVYALARRINEQAGRALIPQRTIDKAPSAELRENQIDQDSLPPYDILDGVLEAYVERDLSVDEVAGLGFDRATVEHVARMVNRNEYKRKQAPVGLKVTTRAFGTGRRMPIAAKYR